MAITYPGTLDALTNPGAASSIVGHAGQHADANDAIEALEAKVGVGVGTPTVNKTLVGSGNGTATWSSTWNAATLGTPTITTATITAGTISSILLGTSQITGGSVASVLLGTSQITGGTATSVTLSTATILGAGGTLAGVLGFGTAAKTLLVGDGAVNEAINVGTWTTYTGNITNVGEGDGTKAMSYAKIGKTVITKCKFTLGSTSTVAGLITVPLPVTAIAGNHSQPCIATLYDNGSSYYIGYGKINTARTDVEIYAIDSGTTYLRYVSTDATTPMTWTQNDSFAFTMAYEAE